MVLVLKTSNILVGLEYKLVYFCYDKTKILMFFKIFITTKIFVEK